MTRRVNLRTSSTPQDRALPISFHALDVLQAGMGVRVFLYVRRALKAPFFALVGLISLLVCSVFSSVLVRRCATP